MLIFYLLTGSGYLAILLLRILGDEETSLKDPIQLKVALIAALIWPVAIPFSLLELKAKALAKPVMMGDGSVRYIKTVRAIEESEVESEPITGWL